MKNWALCAVALALVLVGCSGGGGAGDAPKGAYSRIGVGSVVTTITFNDGNKGRITTDNDSRGDDFTYTWDAKAKQITLNSETGSIFRMLQDDAGCLITEEGLAFCHEGVKPSGNVGGVNPAFIGLAGTYKSANFPGQSFTLNRDGTCEAVGQGGKSTSCTYTYSNPNVTLNIKSAQFPNGTTDILTAVAGAGKCLVHAIYGRFCQ